MFFSSSKNLVLSISLLILIFVSLSISMLFYKENMKSLIVPMDEMVKDEDGKYVPVKNVLGKEKNTKYYKLILDDDDLQQKVPNIVEDSGKMLKYISKQLPE